MLEQKRKRWWLCLAKPKHIRGYVTEEFGHTANAYVRLWPRGFISLFHMNRFRPINKYCTKFVSHLLTAIVISRLIALVTWIMYYFYRSFYLYSLSFHFWENAKCLPGIFLVTAWPEEIWKYRNNIRANTTHKVQTTWSGARWKQGVREDEKCCLFDCCLEIEQLTRIH